MMSKVITFHFVTHMRRCCDTNKNNEVSSFASFGMNNVQTKKHGWLLVINFSHRKIFTFFLSFIC